MSPIEKFKRLISRYPKFFTSKTWYGALFKKIFEQVKFKNINVYCMDSDVIHYIVATNLIKANKFIDIDYYSIYQIIDIYLGGVEDVSCLSEIKADVVAINVMDGMPNKQKGNLIVQMMEQQRMLSKSCWVFYRGTLSSFYSEHPIS